MQACRAGISALLLLCSDMANTCPFAYLPVFARIGNAIRMGPFMPTPTLLTRQHPPLYLSPGPHTPKDPPAPTHPLLQPIPRPPPRVVVTHAWVAWGRTQSAAVMMLADPLCYTPALPPSFQNDGCPG